MNPEDLLKNFDDQPADALEPSEEDLRALGRKTEVMDVEGGESAYGRNGVLHSGGVRECIAVGFISGDYAGLYHMVADQMTPEDISSILSEAAMAADHLGDLENSTWQAIGGYAGQPEYSAEKSIELGNSDQAWARRNRVEGFLKDHGIEHHTEWIREEGELKFMYVDPEEDSFVTRTTGGSDDYSGNPGYLD